ncbi:hypothetical protein [Gordonia iterans]
MTEKKTGPKIPAGAKKPQDRKPKARATEASGDEFAILDVCGLELKVARDQKEWPLAALDAFSEEEHLKGIKALLGRDQWKELLDAGAKAGDLEVLGEQFGEAFGIEQGN